MIHSVAQRYLFGLVIGFALIFGLLWLYIASFPAAFMEGGFALWTAKHSFISNCNLGVSIISGDSRSEAAIDPRALQIPTHNISLGGGTPLEGYFFIKHAMNCRKLPSVVVLSFGMSDFMNVYPYLWEDGGRFGILGHYELDEIYFAAKSLGDVSVDRVKSRLGFGGELRNLLYANYFPPLYFNALLSGRLFGRYGVNQSIFESTVRALGHVPYLRDGTSPPGSIPGDFTALPVQSAFFERTLALLQRQKIQTFFVSMPISPRVQRETKAAANEEFETYLLEFARRYPNFHLLTPLEVVWPESSFQDGVHLEESAVSRFTERFKYCQNVMQRQTGPIMSCDLSWSGQGSATAEQ